MTPGQKFCTECGAPVIPGNRFCGQCGHPVPGQGSSAPQAALAHEAPRPTVSPAGTPGEQVLGIVPFVEQGLLSITQYTLVITSRRMIFCPWDADTDDEMSEAGDEVMQESCDISETEVEIAHFRAKDWAAGPWQRYRLMPADAIAASAAGSITIPLDSITDAEIICETKTSTQDTLHVDEGGRQHSFDLMYSQGPFLFRILSPVLGERISMADHLHRRSRIDRLLTGQEYK